MGASSEKEKATTPRLPRVVTLAAAEVVPGWMSQPHIHSGYRVWHTQADAAWSVFQLHGETLSIYTHALGAVYFLGVLAPYTLRVLDSVHAPWLDGLCFLLFFVGATWQLASSVLYHTFRCVSPAHEARLLALDVSGIVAMIGGSAVCGFLQAFVCTPWVGALYVGVFACPLAVALHYSSLAPEPSHYRTVVAALVAAVAWGAVPCAHMVAQCGVSGECLTTLGGALGGTFGWYGLGFAVFWLRWPESQCWPMHGAFDLVGNSHQVWHCCIVLGGRAWFLGLIELYALRARHPDWCAAEAAATLAWTTRAPG